MRLPLIEAENVELVLQREHILSACTFNIQQGECIAITGKSGAGKTSLAKVIAGHYPVSSGSLQINDEGIRRVFVHQQHDFRFAFHNRTYFGQRFDRNYHGNFPTVRQVLARSNASEMELHEVIKFLQLEEKLDQSIIELSNGEGKRVQLAQALLAKPTLLVLDQPFIGLDVRTRSALHLLLANLKNTYELTLVVVASDEIPTCTDRIFSMNNGEIKHVFNYHDFQKEDGYGAITIGKEVNWDEIRQYSSANDSSFENAVRMENVTIGFDDKLILDDVSWKVKRGEHWALTGENGSGKSTLLSLIYADNPQGYQSEVYLFDKKRGSGESIWDIKRKIGYVSPEMHNFFQRTSSYVEAISVASNDYTLSGFSQDPTTAYETVCSGFNDQIGSSVEVSYFQQALVKSWLEIMDLKHLSNKPFYKASLGEQRLLLLIRSLVKNPPLLLLDEPCQGLDRYQTSHFTSIVNDICKHFEKTLIYVSHYESEMPACIEHRLVLERGKMI
ncbi:ATP-binding cassette domain-containing protein [Solitalea sp. MAHUQ-68]|uniref:ATP-binding cassette domain-containing protein n=1 Tax=Solitalea agri TaxID=2953739 RepID=A0A9X2F5G8_9SPHI|nr:ATP-binding cassette domain-containing protein [Solitalea agri]MCO4292308.1 ATP-binding cassette domain-containing protein [Solitalea agri]